MLGLRKKITKYWELQIKLNVLEKRNPLLHQLWLETSEQYLNDSQYLEMLHLSELNILILQKKSSCSDLPIFLDAILIINSWVLVLN